MSPNMLRPPLAPRPSIGPERANQNIRRPQRAPALTFLFLEITEAMFGPCAADDDPTARIGCLPPGEEGKGIAGARFGQPARAGGTSVQPAGEQWGAIATQPASIYISYL